MQRVAALFLLGLLVAGAAFAGESTIDRSNVLGQDCPELQLEKEMVQGDPITMDDLKGKVVFFLLYQRECEGCERHAMPRVQKLYEEFGYRHCSMVFVINTAFDKDLYPYLADVEETRKNLTRMGWTMPVARDLDEKSDALFTIDDEAGSPQAVVLDENGVVRAHDWYAEDKEMDAVDKVFRTLAAGMNCHCMRMPRKVCESCQGAWNAIKEGKYADAWDKADTIDKSYGYTDKDKQDAVYLKKWIQDTADNKIDKLTKDFQADPEAALPRADDLLKKFAGVTGVKDFARTVKGWRKSDVLSRFRKDRASFEKLQGEIVKAGAKLSDSQRKDVVDRLKAISESAADNRIGGAARAQLQKMGVELKDAVKASNVSSHTSSNGVHSSGVSSGHHGITSGSRSAGTGAARVKAKAAPDKSAARGESTPNRLHSVRR